MLYGFLYYLNRIDFQMLKCAKVFFKVAVLYQNIYKIYPSSFFLGSI